MPSRLPQRWEAPGKLGFPSRCVPATFRESANSRCVRRPFSMNDLPLESSREVRVSVTCVFLETIFLALRENFLQLYGHEGSEKFSGPKKFVCHLFRGPEVRIDRKSSRVVSFRRFEDFQGAGRLCYYTTSNAAMLAACTTLCMQELGFSRPKLHRSPACPNSLIRAPVAAIPAALESSREDTVSRPACNTVLHAYQRSLCRSRKHGYLSRREDGFFFASLHA